MLRQGLLVPLLLSLLLWVPRLCLLLHLPGLLLLCLHLCLPHHLLLHLLLLWAHWEMCQWQAPRGTIRQEGVCEKFLKGNSFHGGPPEELVD